jgi:methyltransferase (TIGR00027 family)
MPLSSGHEVKYISDTAVWVAYFRAKESARPDAIFNDHLAARLCGERAERIAKHMPSAHYSEWSIINRTRALDLLLMEALAPGDIGMVINIAAGLDTRPYRLPLPPDLQWIEIDLPEILEYKTEKLSGETPHCAVERIVCDLADRAARQKLFAGLEARPHKGGILAITEGLMPYLDEAQVCALGEDLHARPGFACWLHEFMSRNPMTQRAQAMLNLHLPEGAKMKFTVPEREKFFTALGWKPEKVVFALEFSKKMNRPFPLPRLAALAFGLRSLFMPREKRRALMQSFGYELLRRI